MQEVDHFHDWFEPRLRDAGYEGRFVKKPHSPCKESLDPSLEDGCALFWRRDLLRLAGLQAETDYQGRSLRALFKAAPKRGVRLMLVLGPEEVQNNSVQVRDLAHSQDLTLPTDDELAGELRKLLVQ